MNRNRKIQIKEFWLTEVVPHQFLILFRLFKIDTLLFLVSTHSVSFIESPFNLLILN